MRLILNTYLQIRKRKKREKKHETFFIMFILILANKPLVIFAQFLMTKNWSVSCENIVSILLSATLAFDRSQEWITPLNKNQQHVQPFTHIYQLKLIPPTDYFFLHQFAVFFVRRERNHAPLSAALFCNAVSSRFQTSLVCNEKKPSFECKEALFLKVKK